LSQKRKTHRSFSTGILSNWNRGSQGEEGKNTRTCRKNSGTFCMKVNAPGGVAAHKKEKGGQRGKKESHEKLDQKQKKKKKGHGVWNAPITKQKKPGPEHRRRMRSIGTVQLCGKELNGAKKKNRKTNCKKKKKGWGKRALGSPQKGHHRRGRT